MNRHSIVCILIVIAVSLAAFAGEEISPLPRNLAPHEYGMPLPHMDDPTPPPDEPCRAIAEWEESEAVIFRWGSYNDILAQIIGHVVSTTKAYIICSSNTQASSCRSYLLGQGVTPIDSVEFLIQATNSVWIRDYAPWWLWRLESWDLAMYEWDYNRPRPLDDVIPEWLAEIWNIEYYGIDLTHTGGNWLLDSWNRAFCSQLIQLENWGLTSQRVTEIFNEYCTLDTVMLGPTFFGIDHMNMYVKLVDDHTVIINQYPEGSPYNDEMEELVEMFSGLSNEYGVSFEVHRVLTENWVFSPYTYCNSLIANNVVVVPQYNHHPNDEDAIALYEELLPGYEVYGVNCSSIIGSGGAVNCITHNIPHPQLIRIGHAPLEDTPNTTEPYQVVCEIASLGTLDDDSLRIYWRSDQTLDWTEEPLVNVSEMEFEAYIPPSSGGLVEYYIYAENAGGNWTTMPRYGPDAHYEFQVGPYELELTLTPENPPIVIPPEGGIIDFNIGITNTAVSSRNFDVWFEVILPSGEVVETFLRENISLPGGADISRDMSQNIPPPAPPGDYIYRAVCGDHPGAVFAEDSFPFTKAGDLLAGRGHNNWSVDGWEGRSSPEKNIPVTYEMKQNYPNPFNPETNIEFKLPVESDVTLAIFNIAGEEVACLIEGRLKAGRHSLEWNAGDMPSGIYFCRLQSAGYSEVKKMMLLK